MSNKKTNETQSDVGQELDLFSLVESSSTLINLHIDYEDVTEAIHEDIDDIKSNYLDIGAKLIYVKDKKLYEVAEYKNIYEYAKDQFELSETTTKNVMAIVKKYCDKDGRLLDEFEEYKFSNLVEMLSVEDSKLIEFKPDMTVKDIRTKKHELKTIKEIELMFDKNGFINLLINKIVDWPWKNNIHNDINLSYLITKPEYHFKNEDDSNGDFDILVTFTFSYDYNKNNPISYVFNLFIDVPRQYFRINSEKPYMYIYMNNDDELVEAIKKIEDRIKDQLHIDTLALMRLERDQENGDLSSVDSDNDQEEKLSPGMYLFKDFHSYSSFDNTSKFIMTFLSLNFSQLYYEETSSYNHSIALFREGKRNKNKNPKLYELHRLDDPKLTRIEILDDKGEVKETIKVFDDIDEYLKNKLEVIKTIIT
ncbi:MAG: hypothetical protein AB7E61_06110 [Acholeplasmataceae bacterium]